MQVVYASLNSNKQKFKAKAYIITNVPPPPRIVW